MIAFWVCTYGHVFPYGNEEWHAESNQGKSRWGELIPCYCTDCSDSSHLFGPFDTIEGATRYYGAWTAP